MELFPSETYLVESELDLLVLTNHRVRLSTKDWGISQTKEIFFVDISSIENKYSSLVLSLMLGIGLLDIVGLLYINEIWWPKISVTLILSLMLLVLWFLSRSKIFGIIPDRGKPLPIDNSNWSTTGTQDFLDKVQIAKFERRAPK